MTNSEGWDRLEREVFASADERWRDRTRCESYRKRGDRIALLILHSDMPAVDIEIEIASFRALVLDDFPLSGELFEAIYGNRFKRLWEQFRPGKGPLFSR